MKTRHKIMSFLLSGAMVFSLLPASAIGTVKAASVNYALTATATASGSETSAFGPEKAKDGDATTKTSRWASEERDASESNPHWLAMDLGEVKTVNSVIITWERRNPTNYAIETSEDGSTWKAVKTFTSAPAEKEQIINLDNPVQTRYIRVRINTFNPTAEGITWKTVSIYEFEVYGEKQSSGSEVWDALNNLTVKAGDKKLNLPTVEGGKVEAYADYEQIIDTDGTIYQPLEDKTVSVEFKVTDQNNKVTKKEIAITVPGTHTATADENAKPAVLPELAEWAGATGNFTISKNSRIVINAADKDTLSSMAETFAADYKDIVGNDISVVYGSDSKRKRPERRRLSFTDRRFHQNRIRDCNRCLLGNQNLPADSEAEQNDDSERNNQRLSKIQSQRCDPGCRTKSNRTSDRKRCCGNNVLVQDE